MTVARTILGARVPMRDGSSMAADVVLPAGDGPFPAVLVRTPYDRHNAVRPGGWRRVCDHGFALVAVDVRGRGDSDGRFRMWASDADDGHDTVEWVAAQTWCSGHVGMVGASYDALTQWHTAQERPPHLSCIVPLSVGAAPFPGLDGKTPELPSPNQLFWAHLVSGRTLQNPAAVGWDRVYAHLPLGEMDEEAGRADGTWPDYLDGRFGYASADCALAQDELDALDVPVLIGVGWWDNQDAIRTWVAMQSSPAAASSHLVVGPWDHAGVVHPRPVLGGLDVSAAYVDPLDRMVAFLDRHLRPDASSAPEEQPPRVRLCDTGRLVWEETDVWPDPATPVVPWYASEGGALDPAAPTDATARDEYRYDPLDPVRPLAAAAAGWAADPPLDVRYLERRPDVLGFTSAVLDDAVRISGEVRARLFVSLDVPETDLVVWLSDVRPDGRSIQLGGLFAGPTAVRVHPDGREPIEVTVVVGFAHHTFLPGHRIRLSVTSSWFPSVGRNPNTGEDRRLASAPRPATVSVHRGGGAASCVELPVTT